MYEEPGPAPEEASDPQPAKGQTPAQPTQSGRRSDATGKAKQPRQIPWYIVLLLIILVVLMAVAIAVVVMFPPNLPFELPQDLPLELPFSP